MRVTTLLLALCLLWGPLPARAAEVAPADAAAARAVVDGLHEVLLTCMKQADELGYEGRYKLVYDALPQAFDLPFMARLSVGDAWKSLDNQQRADFVDLSRRLSAASYADNFDGFSGQQFTHQGEEPAAHKTIVVKTTLVLPDDDDVTFDYRVRQSRNGWRIIDVQIDGKISEITLRRSDYRSTIARNGFPYLVDELEKKILAHARGEKDS